MIKREDDKICVWGARVHNLKNIDVEIPRGSLTVITGLSPSVSRACIMIAVWKTADSLCQSKDRTGPLLTAAFVIALFNPMAVEMIGFQLSFAAVAGIVFLYPAVEESIRKVIGNKRSFARRIAASGMRLMGITMTC